MNVLKIKHDLNMYSLVHLVFYNVQNVYQSTVVSFYRNENILTIYVFYFSK